ncbi:MAG TPA: phosphate ABC transporter permease [Candidatus Pacebacteria bacterium]|nr:phosphate ABC transporter permease [Candidatus Paceibacterota bacterium]
MSVLTIFTKYHELLSELTWREIKQRYKQSVLGYAWVILNPLFQMLVMAFVFSKIMRMPTLGVPYSIYLYAGLLPWTLFANSLTGAVNSLVGNAGLITKIYFPREVFVASAVLAKIVDFLLATSVFVVFAIYFQTPFTWHLLWILPIFLIQQLFTYALALFLAAANLFYRDVQYVFNLVILIWMYLTPVIYPVELFPDQYRWIFQLNPMAVIVNAYRQVLLAGAEPNYLSLALAASLSLILLTVCFKFFKKVEGVFADIV